MITSHDRLKVPNRPRRALLVVPAVAAGLAALAACSSSSSSSSSAPKQHAGRRHPAAPPWQRLRLRRRSGDRRGPEDREYRRRDGPDERQGLHALLVRARHVHQVGLQRGVRDGLAAADGARDRSRARTPPSSEPTARPSSPSTGTRCTPSSATPPRSQPTATASTPSADCGTKSQRPVQRAAALGSGARLLSRIGSATAAPAEGIGVARQPRDTDEPWITRSRD